MKSQKLMQSTSARFVIINMNKMAIDENHSGGGNGFNNDEGDHFSIGYKQLCSQLPSQATARLKVCRVRF